MSNIVLPYCANQTGKIIAKRPKRHGTTAGARSAEQSCVVDAQLLGTDPGLLDVRAVGRSLAFDTLNWISHSCGKQGKRLDGRGFG